MRVSLKFRERLQKSDPEVLQELEQLVAAISQGWATEHTLDGEHAGISGVYYVSDTSGGAVTRKLTFTHGILTSES